MLDYKAINITNAEYAYKKNFFEVISQLGSSLPSMTDILFLLEAGGVSKEDAGKLIDESGFSEAQAKIMEGLSEAGFLGKSEEAEEARKATKVAAQVLKTSESTGETAKS